MTTFARLIAVALVVLAIADLRIGWPTDDLAVAVVIDESASVSQAERDTLTAELGQIQAAQSDVAWLDIDAVDDEPMQTDLAGQVELAIATGRLKKGWKRSVKK